MYVICIYIITVIFIPRSLGARFGPVRFKVRFVSLQGSFASDRTMVRSHRIAPRFVRIGSHQGSFASDRTKVRSHRIAPRSGCKHDDGNDDGNDDDSDDDDDDDGDDDDDDVAPPTHMRSCPSGLATVCGAGASQASMTICRA